MTGHTSQPSSRLTRRQRAAFALIAVVCILLAGATLAAAQVGTFQDDFEDENVDGWEGNPSIQLSDTAVDGDHSLFVRSADPPIATWESGPTLNLEEEFTISGVMRHNRVNGTSTGVHTRIGIEGNSSIEGDNVFLNYNEPSGVTFLANWENEETPSSSADNAIGDSFNNEWVRFEIHSAADSGLAQAKVWEYGTQEPAEYQMERQFDGVSGPFAVHQGTIQDEYREGWLDSVSIEGETVEDSVDLNLDAPNYMRPNTTAHYTVEANQSGTWEDVTDEATITVEDPDAATFYPSNGTVVATNNTGYVNETNVTAAYEGLQDSERMTVASPTVENLDILPTWWKVNATLGDGMMLWLIVATLAAVVATRAATPFAGVGAYVMFMIAGWMTGSVSDGVMVATILTGLFLGMNLAANVDTTIRGSG